MSLGARLTKLRLKAGQSLQQVADSVDVSKAHIWDLEKGRAANPSMGLVTKLADHFGVSVASLVGEDAGADDADLTLARMFRQASKLSEPDREILDTLMQSLLEAEKKRRKKSS